MVIADVLHQADHVVPSCVEDLFVSEGRISFLDLVTESIVLSQEEDLQGRQAHIFDTSYITCKELTIITNW